MRNSFSHKFLAATILIALMSCSPAPTIKNLSEAHAKFLKLCQEEYKLDVILTPLENTVWIYVPVTEGIIDIKATGHGLKTSAEGAPAYNLNFIGGGFKDDEFQISYDISKTVKYPKDAGYGSAYDEGFTLIYQSIYQAIQRTYLDAEDVSKVPEFFVIVFADIINGIEVKTIFNFTDYNKEMSQALAMDESPKRKINQVSGNKNIIGDRKGKYLDIKEITWPEFLTEQIVQRVNLAYGENRKPPSDNPEELILETIALVVKIYNFEDYQSILLNNLNTSQSRTLDKALIASYDITDLNPKPINTK